MKKSFDTSSVHQSISEAEAYWSAFELFSKSTPPGPEKDEPLKDAPIKDSHRAPPKEYKEGGADEKTDYADKENYKYPIDNAKHVRAAISYFAKPKNHGIYSSSERKAVASRIASAAKREGVDVSDEWKKKFNLK